MADAVDDPASALETLPAESFEGYLGRLDCGTDRGEDTIPEIGGRDRGPGGGIARLWAGPKRRCTRRMMETELPSRRRSLPEVFGR